MAFLGIITLNPNDTPWQIYTKPLIMAFLGIITLNPNAISWNSYTKP